MGNFGNKWNKFVQIFIEKNGYVKVVQGLQNTLLIAVVGMIMTVLNGCSIDTVLRTPEYNYRCFDRYHHRDGPRPAEI